MKLSSFLPFLLALFLPENSFSVPESYQIISASKSSVHFFLPYSMGTAEGDAKEIQGTLKLDFDHPENNQGTFQTSLDSITTGNPTKDCHLREALGLDYSQSNFPQDHVCDHDDHLPRSGKNSVVYPNVQLKIKSIQFLKLSSGKAEVTGEWTLHGVTQPAHLNVSYRRDGKNLRFQGETTFSLKSYGVEVKSAHVLFATIRVQDQARVVFDLELQPQSPAGTF